MANYWQSRMTNVQANITDKGIAAINKQIKKYYNNVMQRTINDFEALYDKVLAQAEDGKPITVADLYKLDKYYQTQAQLKNRLQILGDNSCTLLSKKFEQEYKHVYSALAIDAKGQVVKAAVSDAAWNTIDEQAAKYAAEQIWCADGKSWSQRVWGNVNDLQQALNDNLIDCVVRGKKTTYLRDVLRERFNVSYHRANTLIRTEMAHIETQAARDRYMADGLKYYQFLADPDERTCDVCASLDKKKFALKDMKPGVNAPPMHPNDRCCIIPVIDTKRIDDIMINTPIEQRNTGKGNPNAIWSYGVPLNNRQQRLLDAMPQYDSRIIVSKNQVNMTDLAALTAETGDEFAMFTKGGDRLIIRGDTKSVNVDIETARKLAEEGYKWSGHTHPGLELFVLQASEGDCLILEQFEQ